MQAFYTSLADGKFAAWVETEVHRCLEAQVQTSQALLAEASFRHFFRIRLNTGSRSDTLIAMYAPPELENTRRFVKLADLFARHGIGVPRLCAHDLTQGFVLMEDLGDDLLERVYARGETRRALALAVETLVRMQSITTTSDALPDYTRERFEMELGIFSDHFLRGFIDRPQPDWYQRLSGILVENALRQPRCCIHRDFHCRNLLIKPSGELGVVDFQDALMGPLTYDLAALLGDCYHAFEEDHVMECIENFRRSCEQSRRDSRTTSAQIPREDTLYRHFELMVMHRQLKAVGIFARLWLTRRRRSHLSDIAPVLERLAERADRHAFARPLADTIRGDYLPRAAARLESISPPSPYPSPSTPPNASAS